MRFYLDIIKGKEIYIMSDIFYIVFIREQLVSQYELII